MKIYLWIMPFLCAVFCMQSVMAGSRWEGTVVILGSEPNPIGDYRKDFQQFRDFETSREQIHQRWSQACMSTLAGGNSLVVSSSDMEVVATGTNGFQAGYWIIYLSGEGDPAALMQHAKSCAPDAYVRKVVIGEPLRPPVCSWACAHDQELYFEYCAATDFLLMMPEQGVNPFQRCNVPQTAYQSWRAATFPDIVF